MAEYKRLVKLHIELDKKLVKPSKASIALVTLKLSLAKYAAMYRKNFKRKYPVSFSDVFRLLKIYRTGTDYYVGIVYDYLTPKDRPLYLKMLEVEYGVNGIEQRVLRRALEECFINL